MKKAILISLPVLIGAIGITLWYFSSADWRAATGALDADIVKAKALGIPLETSDLDLPRNLSDSDNAAMTLLAAEAEQNRSAPDKKTLEAVNKALTLPDADAASLSAQLKPFDKTLSVIQKIKTQNAANFNREWGMGSLITFPDLSECRQLVKMLASHAEIASIKGDWQTCLNDLDLIRKIAMVQGSEPTLISMLVAVSEEQIALRTAERALTRMAANAEAVEHLRQFAAAPSPLPNFRKALMGEVYFQVSTIRNLELFGGEQALERTYASNTDGADPEASPLPSADKLAQSGLPKDNKGRAYLARALEFWITALHSPNVDDPLALSKAIDEQAKKISDSSDPTQRLLKFSLPVFGQAGNAIVRTEAQRRTLAALCSVVAFKQRTGHFPATLAEAGDHTLDPYTKQPLKMQTDGVSFRVYSVAADGVDNKGHDRIDQTHSESEAGQSDIVSVYPTFARKKPK